MTNRTAHQCTHIVLAMVLCLALTACLPGKKREERVIAQTQSALKDVQAEKVAADMINGAQALLGSTEEDTPETNSTNLRTVRCTDGSVMAYVPRSAQIAKNGAIPQVVADRMRNQIKATNNAAQIGDANMVTACGNADISIETVALNAPVMMLTMAAQEDITIADVAEARKMTVEPCGNGQKGMRVITNGQVDTSLCRDDAGAYFDIETSETTIPNYKAVLSDEPVEEEQQIINFTCIAGEEGCAKIDTKIEDKIVCKQDGEKQEFVINPVYSAPDKGFIPTNTSADCGHGWTGELITRVIQKKCTVYRDGKAENLPGKVIDVAFVGAKCRKSDALLEDTCPLDAPRPNGQMLTSYNVQMTEFLAMQPTESKTVSGANVSTIAYKGIDPETQQVVSNTTAEIETLAQSPLKVDYVSGQANEKLFISETPIDNNSGSYRFDNFMIQELRNQGKNDETPVTCFALDQTCSGAGEPLEMVGIVLDRSGSMSAPPPLGPELEVIRTETSCRATMANLFQPNDRTAACTAAREWHVTRDAQAEAHAQVNMERVWDPNTGPVEQGAAYYEEQFNVIRDIDAAAAARMQQQLDIMSDLLIDKANIERLKTQLSNGQDCYPTFVPDNTYGHCAPIYASPEQLAKANFTGVGPDTLKSCQSTCPGECITDAVQRTDVSGNVFKPSRLQQQPRDAHKPVVETMRLIGVVDNFVRGNLIPNIPGGALVYYSEFYASVIDDPDSPDAASRPILNEYYNPNSEFIQSEDRTYFWRRFADQIQEKLEDRGTEEGSGMTPLYQSTDIALEQMLTHKLIAGPEARTNLILLTDGIDTIGPSKYFGTNVCDAEPIPERQVCTQVVRRECPKNLLGGCKDPAVCLPGEHNFGCVKFRNSGRCEMRACGSIENAQELNFEDVRTLFGIDTPTTRTQYCKSKYGEQSDYTSVYSETPLMGQVDSLVGIVGRNFPNTKVFYMGFADGALLAQKCKEENSGLNQFYSSTGQRVDQIQVMFPFAYDESASAEIFKDFNAATNGSSPDALYEVGAEMCRDRYDGEGGSINILPTSGQDPQNILNTEGTGAAPDSCGVAFYKVDDPENPDLLPPYYVPNPVMPPPSTPIYSPTDNCLTAYDYNNQPFYIDRYTMERVTDPSLCGAAGDAVAE